jgi:hypothetical protein
MLAKGGELGEALGVEHLIKEKVHISVGEQRVFQGCLFVGPRWKDGVAIIAAGVVLEEISTRLGS